MNDLVTSEVMLQSPSEHSSGAVDVPVSTSRISKRVAISRTSQGTEGLMILRTTTGLRFERPTDIEWLEADANYAIFNIRGEQVRVRMTLNELERTLDPQRFLRISRSIILNLAHARQAVSQGGGQYVFEMRGGQRLVSSRCRKHAIRSLTSRASRW